VLTTLCQVAAPLLPLITDEVHRGLTGSESVHLTDWPDAEAFPADAELVASMDRVRDVCSTALSLREDHGLRTRLPLRSLTVAGRGAPALEPLAHLVREEVNVKAVELTEDLEAHGRFLLQPDGRVLGPRLGPGMRAVIQGARAGDWTLRDDGTVAVGGQVLVAGEFELRLEPKEGEASQALRTNDAVVVLDVQVTPELEAEGLARDLVRKVQQARKDADLRVTDRIDVWLDLPPAARDAVRTHETFLREQVLAVSVVYGPVPDGVIATQTTLGGEPLGIGLRVATS
jgi:isoleucyl-tRNA synthetase